jgi:hypothetical protein
MLKKNVMPTLILFINETRTKCIILFGIKKPSWGDEEQQDTKQI